MTEYFVYADCFVRVSVQEIGPTQFAWEYQINGGDVYQGHDRLLPTVPMALRLGLCAARAHVDQID